jgi:hypothetical protein
MSKLTFVFTVVIASLAGCAGESANSSPPAAAPADGVDFKYNGPDEDESPKAKDESSESESKKAEPAKSESTASKTNKSDSTESSPAPHKACPGLTKTQCQISAGCAWHTDNKCVAQ